MSVLKDILAQLLSHKKLLFAGGAVLAFAIAFIVLLVRYIRLKRSNEELRMRLSHQMERVEARKSKILKLRKVIVYLWQENQKQREIIAERPQKEEMQKNFERMTDRLLKIYRESKPIDKTQRQRLDGDFAALADAMVSSMGVNSRADLPWNKTTEGLSDSTTVSRSADKRVLIVDDNKSTGAALARILEGKGYRVERAESGEEAKTMFLHSPEGYYSFIFMDIVLKGMNGYDTAREIRRSYRSDSERLPIIAMTTNSFPEDLISIQNAGMNERLLKPISEESVTAELKKWNAMAENTDIKPQKGENGGKKSKKAEDEEIDNTWESLTPPKEKTGKKSARDRRK